MAKVELTTKDSVRVVELKSGDVFLLNGKCYIVIDIDSFVNIIGNYSHTGEDETRKIFEECGVFTICLNDGNFCEMCFDTKVIPMSKVRVE